jgi:hypothetical protein
LSTRQSIESDFAKYRNTGLASVIAGIAVGLISGGAGIALLELPLVGQDSCRSHWRNFSGRRSERCERRSQKTRAAASASQTRALRRQLQKVLAQEKISLLQTIKDQMANNTTWADKLKDDIMQELQRVLNEQVEKAVMWIK